MSGKNRKAKAAARARQAITGERYADALRKDTREHEAGSARSDAMAPLIKRFDKRTRGWSATDLAWIFRDCDRPDAFAARDYAAISAEELTWACEHVDDRADTKADFRVLAAQTLVDCFDAWHAINGVRGNVDLACRELHEVGITRLYMRWYERKFQLCIGGLEWPGTQRSPTELYEEAGIEAFARHAANALRAPVAELEEVSSPEVADYLLRAGWLDAANVPVSANFGRGSGAFVKVFPELFAVAAAEAFVER